MAAPVEWLARGWVWFLHGSIADWKRAEDPVQKTDEFNNINEAVEGLERVYGIRMAIWLLLGVSTLGTGLLIQRNKGYSLALTVILFWLGGSPIPRKLTGGYLPDDNDAILLAGMLPMLIALTILFQRFFQVLGNLARTNPRVGQPLLITVILLIFGGALAITIADGGIDETTLITTGVGTVTAIVVGALIAIFRKR